MRLAISSASAREFIAMYRSTFIQCLVLVFALCFFSAKLHGDEIPPEAVASWENLLRKMDVTQVQEATSSHLEKGRCDSLATFLARGDCRIVMLETEYANDSTGLVLGKNDKYCFELRKPRRGPWVLAGLRPLSHPGAKQILHQLDVNEHSLRSRPLDVNHLTVLEIVRHSSFILLSGKRIPVENNELFEFEFKVDPKAEIRPGKRMRFSGGRIVLDKSKGWLPIESRVDGMRIVNNDFREHNGVFVPQSVSFEVTGANGKVTAFTSRVPLIEFGKPKPEAAFTLSAFGLPEPSEGSPTSQGLELWHWVFVLGVAMLAAGTLIKWRASRASIANA
jgi:hypothetical protein